MLILFLLLSISTINLHAQPATELPLPKIVLTDTIRRTEVKDQSQSPTCWVFGTNSLFESDLLKKYELRMNLSEMYIARYAYIDKAKQYLASDGKTYFAGGGQFHDVLRVVNRFGMVPEEVYSGKAAKYSNHDHSAMDTAMKRFMEPLLAQGKKTLTANESRQLNDTLDKYLGKLPQIFCYQQEEYNPQTFAKQVLCFQNDYVELMSFADQPLYKKCLLVDKYNWAGDSLYNISLEDMQMVVDTALARGWSVGWEGDVTEPGFNYNAGYAAVPDSAFDMEEKRCDDFKTEKTVRDHMLHLVGAGRDENNKKWYYLKNSWGTWLSKYRGYLFMQESYFKLKTMIMMVNKEALPAQLKEKLGLK